VVPAPLFQTGRHPLEDQRRDQHLAPAVQGSLTNLLRTKCPKKGGGGAPARPGALASIRPYPDPQASRCCWWAPPGRRVKSLSGDLLWVIGHALPTRHL
jgi:hypothetical protein